MFTDEIIVVFVQRELRSVMLITHIKINHRKSS